MGRQTRSTTKAAAASSRPGTAGETAASTRPKRVRPRPSSRSPQRVNVAVAKPRVPRTNEQKINEKARKRGRTFYGKGKELAEQCKIPVIALYRDPKLGWDGFVCHRGTSWHDFADIIRRVHERGPLERRRGRRAKTHLQDLVEVHVNDDTAPIEANDDQEENDGVDDIDDIDDEHAAGVVLDDPNGENEDANGYCRVAHATDDRVVGRDIYSFDGESPPAPLGMPQASEPGSDVPALEPTGSSSPQREVDGVQSPATPPAAAGDIDLSTFMAGDDWMQYPMQSFDACVNSNLDALLYDEHCQQGHAPHTVQPCPSEPGMGTKPQSASYPAKLPVARRRRLRLMEALITQEMWATRWEAENLKIYIDSVAKG